MSKVCVRLSLFSIFLCTAFGVKSSDNCDIAGLDKVLVVKALWQHSVIAPAARRFTPELADRVDISDEDVQKALSQGYIEYLNCRLIKADFSGDSFSTYSYNRDNGAGAAEKIIAELRK